MSFEALHPFWLLLLIFGGIMLLIAGCTALPTRTPAPIMTQTPHIVLTEVPFPQPQPLPPALPPASTYDTPERIRTASPPSLIARQPRCYPRANDGFTCLGLLHNTGTQAVRAVQVLVSLNDDSGNRHGAQVILAPQRLIPPQGRAPYRALFTSVPDDVTRIDAQILRSQNADMPSHKLRIIEDRGVQNRAGRYVVTARIINEDTKNVTRGRAIITLLNAADDVVGFRVLSLPQTINAGEIIPLRVEVIPLLQSDDLHHILTLDVD